MNDNKNNDDTLLAKWLSGELDGEDLKAFELSKDFALYQKIAEVTGKLRVTPPNLAKKLSEQKKYNVTYEKEKKTKTISIKPWLYGVAASIAILFGLFLFQDHTTHIKTQLAETKTYTLPDGSIVTLNADSEITFNENEFLTERSLKLKGEAYFKVQKGSAFTVFSTSGSVQVLGTAFNVYDRDLNFKVYCSEGKVKVKTTSGKELIITKNKGTISNTKTPLSLTPNDTPLPQWQTGKSVFSKTTLFDVFAEIERQFAVNVDRKDINTNRKFTGFFYHKNIEEALNQVCKPMNIEFKITDKKVLLNNK